MTATVRRYSRRESEKEIERLAAAYDKLKEPWRFVVEGKGWGHFRFALLS